jgi:hypothetical protein
MMPRRTASLDLATSQADSQGRAPYRWPGVASPPPFPIGGDASHVKRAGTARPPRRRQRAVGIRSGSTAKTTILSVWRHPSHDPPTRAPLLLFRFRTKRTSSSLPPRVRRHVAAAAAAGRLSQPRRAARPSRRRSAAGAERRHACMLLHPNDTKANHTT